MLRPRRATAVVLTGVAAASLVLATVAVDPALAGPGQACRPVVAEQPDGRRAGVSCPDGPTGRLEVEAASGSGLARVGTPPTSEEPAPESEITRGPDAEPGPQPGSQPPAARRVHPRRHHCRRAARAEAGPLAPPVRTAAIVAVLGVFVMTVSVGALSAAVRVR